MHSPLHARSLLFACVLIAPSSALLGLSALKSSKQEAAPATPTRLDFSKKLVTELDAEVDSEEEIKRQCIELGIVRELRMPDRNKCQRQGVLNRLWMPISSLPERIVRLPFRASKAVYRAPVAPVIGASKLRARREPSTEEHGLAGYDILSNVSLAKYPLVRFTRYPRAQPAVVFWER